MARPPRASRGTKYGARPTWSALCRRQFASAAEARRAEELTLLERGGAIRGLVCQPDPYVLSIQPRITYRPDFAYETAGDRPSLAVVVEDVKGMLTREGRVKLAWLADRLGVHVTLLRWTGRGWESRCLTRPAPRPAQTARTSAAARKRRARMPRVEGALGGARL